MKKRIISALLIALFHTMTSGAIGDSASNPILISDINELQAMNDGLHKHYRLTQNIDASETSTWNQNGISYEGFEPIGRAGIEFTGSLNGAGFVVSNLYVNRPASMSGVGVIGAARGAIIDSLGVEDVYLDGNHYTGAIVGFSINNTIVRNCYSSGEITGNGYIGGIVGRNYSSCSVTQSFSSAYVHGNTYVGGIVGVNNAGSSISNSYFTGNIYGNSYIGGVVGFNVSSSILNAYSSGVVTGSFKTGGVAGDNASGTITSTFWDNETSGILIGMGDDNNNQTVLGMNSSDMKLLATFTAVGWDFVGEVTNGTDDIWNINASGYPFLAFHSASPTVTYNAGVDGSVLGNLTQSVVLGTDGTPVTATPVSGSQFVRWSDGRTDNPRIDYNVVTDLSITAKFLTFEGGSGTESDPFQVSTIDQLQSMIERPDLHYRLVNDIDASETKNWNNGAGFEPIGNLNRKFSGSLNGAGYEISNLYINRPESGYIGVIGYAFRATIDSLGVVGGNYTGRHYVGGIAGEIQQNTVVKNSYSNCTVKGSFYVGGLVGYSVTSTEVSNSYATGTVTGQSTIGGLVGCSHMATIKNSYSTGAVIGNVKVGGFTGINYSTISDCFWNIENSQVDSGIGNAGDYDKPEGKTGAEMKISATYTNSGWDFTGETNNGTDDIWKINANGYPYLSYNDNTSFTVSYSDDSGGSVTGQLSQTVALGSDGTEVIAIPDSGYVFWKWSDGLLDSSRTDVNIISDIKYTAEFTKFKGGTGTVDDPFLIATLEQLQKVKERPGLHYRLAQDIDASETKVWNSGRGFEPLGNMIMNFTGSFNGAGYVISDIYINQPDKNYLGVFGIVSGASIDSLNIVGSVINGNSYAGGVVGKADDTTVISYCSFTGDINTASSYCGGIAGEVRSGSTIQYSYTSGTVKSRYGSGGIAGYFGGSFIKESYSMADVFSGASAGGIVGANMSSSIISQSFSLGSVSGGYRVGGLVGISAYGSQVVNSYSTGAITGDSLTGGVVGYNMDSSKVSNSFWNIETSGINSGIGVDNNSQTVYGKTDVEMMTLQTFVNNSWDFDVAGINGTQNVWCIDADTSDYPLLQWNTSTLSYRSSAYGALSGDTIQYVIMGRIGDTVVAEANEGCEFTGWDDGFNEVARVDCPGMDMTYTANFEINTFTLTYRAAENGTVTSDSIQVVNYGGDGVPVTAIPDSGYKFVNWSDGNSSATRTDVNITENLIVTANFDNETEIADGGNIKTCHNLNGIQVGPNPATLSSGYVKVVVNVKGGRSVQITIYDNLGEVIDKQNGFINFDGSRLFEWDLRNKQGQQVASGIYKVVAVVKDHRGDSKRFEAMIGVSD